MLVSMLTALCLVAVWVVDLFCLGGQAAERLYNWLLLPLHVARTLGRVVGETPLGLPLPSRARHTWIGPCHEWC